MPYIGVYGRRKERSCSIHGPWGWVKTEFQLPMVVYGSKFREGSRSKCCRISSMSSSARTGGIFSVPTIQELDLKYFVINCFYCISGTYCTVIFFVTCLFCGICAISANTTIKSNVPTFCSDSFMVMSKLNAGKRYVQCLV